MALTPEDRKAIDDLDEKSISEIIDDAKVEVGSKHSFLPHDEQRNLEKLKDFLKNEFDEPIHHSIGQTRNRLTYKEEFTIQEIERNARKRADDRLRSKHEERI
jgi:hypothetical protein